MSKKPNVGYHMRLVRPANENKAVFAGNLDWLLKATGLSRKKASDALGVDYRVIRRLVTAGVSRPDKRNKDVLDKIKTFFGLNSISELWLTNLSTVLLTEKETGAKFVKKFRDPLKQHFSGVNDSDWLSESLGQSKNSSEVSAKDKSRRAVIRQVNFILSSSIGSRFESVVRDYYSLAQFKQTG